MTKEILDLTEKIQKRVLQNVDIVLKEEDPDITYQDAFNTAVIMEIAALALVIKKMQK